MTAHRVTKAVCVPGMVALATDARRGSRRVRVMNNRLTRLCAFAEAAAFALLVCVALPAAGWAADQTPNAIVVVIDGARYAETFGADGQRNIPHIWNDLRPQGTIHTGFYNHGQTVTFGAHATMLTGNNSWISFPDWAIPELNRPATPTLFEYFRTATGADPTQAWLVANLGMTPLEAMTYSTHPGYGSAYGASWLLAPREDEDVIGEVVGLMDQYHPRLLLVNLHGVDRWAHTGRWARYIERIRNADNLVYLLWQKIQSDPFYVDQTTFIVTTDHGRHSRNFEGHGDCCTGCQHIMFLALGPQIRQGQELSAPRRYLENIGPTLGWLMGVPMPYVVDGEVMPELLTTPPAEVPAQYLPREGLEVSIATRDEWGVPRTVFRPGETVFLDGSVVSHADTEVMIYQQTERHRLCPDGEVCERNLYWIESPIFLAPGDSWSATYEATVASATPLGEWPISVEWRSVDAAGDLVHGTRIFTVTIE